MFFKIFLFLFGFSVYAASPNVVVDFMEKDSVNKVQRPWFPTTLPDYKLSASMFSCWAVFGTPELSDQTSASCFEIVLLYAIKSGTVDREWVKNQYKFIEGSIAYKGKDRVSPWIQAWLSLHRKYKRQRQDE